MNPITPPTVEAVAAMLAEIDGTHHDGNDWHVSASTTGPVVEDEQTPIVLPRPDRPGLTWDDGKPLLAKKGKSTIVLHTRGADTVEMTPDEALEWAAHLAAFALTAEGGEA